MPKPKRMADCHPERPHCAKGLCRQCYERGSQSGRNWREKNPKYGYDWALKNKYGITLGEYDKILEDQNNRCAICGMTPEENDRRLCVDHNHETGETRALLCSNCNAMLGLAQDNISILSRAIEYLESHREVVIYTTIKQI